MQEAERISAMKKDESMTYNLISHLGTLSGYEDESGSWSKEVNIVSWNHNAPVIDIRSWNEDHSQMTSGIKLTQAELMELINSIKKWSKNNGKR